MKIQTETESNIQAMPDSSEGHLYVILAGILAAGVVKHPLPLTDGTD
ncbi:hypothetical protein ACY19I_19555 [Morganella morganii]|nr:hypothetical protein [Morganella morganii]HCR3557425.1 hypothetical protein [Morganella morganii]HCR3762720.1 hypothetical protein [Morganella morganii]HCT5327141.1 hypothetical protein [Morganella morganii]